MSAASTRQTRPGRSWPLVAGAAVAAAILAAFALFAWLWLDRMRAEQLAAEERLADSFEQHARSTLSLAALALAAVEERLTREGRRPAFDPAIQTMLASLMERAPGFTGLRVVDGEGRYLHSWPDRPVSGTRVPDRDYFYVHREASPGLFVGKPVISRVTGEWVLPISIGRQDGRGRFNGVVVSVLRLADFLQPYSAAGATVSLFRLHDGVLLARSPMAPELLGENRAGDPLFRQHLPKGPRGSFAAPASHDGKAHHTSFRALPDWDVVVAVSTADDDATIAWATALRPWAALTLSLAFAALAGGWMAGRLRAAPVV